MAKELKEYAKFYGLDALVADTFGVPLAEDDITIVRLAELAGCTWETARRTLQHWERIGKVESIGKRRAPSGKLLDAWRLVEAETDPLS